MSFAATFEMSVAAELPWNIPQGIKRLEYHIKEKQKEILASI